ncbi:MAG: 4-(cytidine 5'-diphospho)-2-C-methyl-D-erythritol kinase [Acidobacteriota bacterium]
MRSRPKRIAIEARSFAKVNLGLAVGARRADGFHELLTLYQSIGLADTMRIERKRSPGISLLCDDPAVPTDDRNLVVRAYRALHRVAGRLPGLQVSIEKRIPVGGGLGGGSSNAGTFLRAVDRWLGLDVPLGKLALAAAELGSDVPFFLVGGLALGLGRGEVVVPLADLPRRWVALVMPAQGLPTASVYARLAELRAASPSLTPTRTGGKIHAFLLEGLGDPSELGNDLAPAARGLMVGYDDVLGRLREAGAELALLSGSGSTFFGLFQEYGEAQGVREATKTTTTKVTHTVGRREYLRGVLPELTDRALRSTKARLRNGDGNHKR